MKNIYVLEKVLKRKGLLILICSRATVYWWISIASGNGNVVGVIITATTTTTTRLLYRLYGARRQHIKVLHVWAHCIATVSMQFSSFVLPSFFFYFIATLKVKMKSFCTPTSCIRAATVCISILPTRRTNKLKSLTYNLYHVAAAVYILLLRPFAISCHFNDFLLSFFLVY